MKESRVRHRAKENMWAMLEFRSDLVRRREEVGLTVGELAEKIGWSVDQVNHFENYAARPNTSEIMSYANGVEAFIKMEVVPDVSDE